MGYATPLKPICMNITIDQRYRFAIQVEIVMGLEEAFDITVQEDSAQTIATVQDAADLIEDLVMEKDV